MTLLGVCMRSITFWPSVTTVPNGAPGFGTAETVTMRSRSLRSMAGGAKRSTTVPTSRTRTARPWLL